MATARRKKTTKKPARRNASCRAACGASRRNPTTYARKLPAPFNRFTARDWEHVARTAARLEEESMGDAWGEPVGEEVMTSQGYAEVGHDGSGAFVSAYGVTVQDEDWPSGSRTRRVAKRSKRPAGSRRARKVNARSNPRRARRRVAKARPNRTRKSPRRRSR